MEFIADDNVGETICIELFSQQRVFVKHAIC